jgi:predicted DNA-binding transcriptional regulator YafY
MLTADGSDSTIGSDIMRADRLLAMVARLQVRGRVTAVTLAEELDVSVRTVYRDVLALTTAGIPICTEAGPGGGIWLMEGYRSSLTGLTPAEASALVALSVPGPLNDIGLSGLVADAQLKLLATLPVAGDDDGTRFLLDAPPWFRASEDAARLPPLVEAVRRQQRLSIVYRGAAETAKSRRYLVAPLGLVNKAGQWYLAARLRRRIRAFRVARISSVTGLAEKFARPPGFDLHAFWSLWTGEFEASLRRLPVVVRVTPSALSELPHVFGDSVREAIDAASEPDADGRQTVRLSFESEEWACARLMGFGTGLEVLEPQSLRAQMVAHAESVIALHSTAPR